MFTSCVIKNKQFAICHSRWKRRQFVFSFELYYKEHLSISVISVFCTCNDHKDTYFFVIYYKLKRKLIVVRNLYLYLISAAMNFAWFRCLSDNWYEKRRARLYRWYDIQPSSVNNNCHTFKEDCTVCLKINSCRTALKNLSKIFFNVASFTQFNY